MSLKRLKRIPVLLYHKIGSPPEGSEKPRTWVPMERFSWQMRFLSNRGYRTISPGEVLSYYRGEREKKGKEVLITFDDGSGTNLTNAFPLMESLGFFATIFIVAGHLGGTAEWDHDPVIPDDELLSLEEIWKLIKGGWTIGSHTMTHPRFSNIDHARAREEIFSSKKNLEDCLRIPITTFAYPYGVYSDGHPGLVRAAGYDISFTTHYPEQGLYAVRRENIHGEVNALRFLWRFYRARRGHFSHVES